MVAAGVLLPCKEYKRNCCCWVLDVYRSTRYTAVGVQKKRRPTGLVYWYTSIQSRPSVNYTPAEYVVIRTIACVIPADQLILDCKSKNARKPKEMEPAGRFQRAPKSAMCTVAGERGLDQRWLTSHLGRMHFGAADPILHAGWPSGWPSTSTAALGPTRPPRVR